VLILHTSKGIIFSFIFEGYMGFFFFLVVFVRCNIRDGATNYTELVKNITGVEAIIYVGGIDQSMEGESADKPSIDLPDVQKELLVALKGLKVPLIEVICTGCYC
jgi:hypothetical protein